MSAARLLTFAKAAAQLRYPTVAQFRRALVSSGLLPIVTITARKRFVTQAAIDAFLAKRTTKGA